MRALKSETGDRHWFVLYVVVCMEVGIFLILAPWSAIWERNFFLELYPSLGPIFLAPAFGGAVAGLGVANLYMGLAEVVNRHRLAAGEAEGGRGGRAPSEGGEASAASDETGRMTPSDRQPIATAEERR